MQNDDNVLIVVPDSSKLSDLENWHSISEIERKLKPRSYQGSKLFNLLDDVGAITLDENNELVLSSFYKTADAIPRLLGFLAEALVVESCEQNLYENRKWANYARRFPFGSENLLTSIDIKDPDQYIPIGVGLARTQKNFKTKHLYSRTDTRRDICWVHKNNTDIELFMVAPQIKDGGSLAGLQIKLSAQNSGGYVYYSILNRMYNVPVVYFDIGNDFTRVKDRLIKISQEEKMPPWLNRISHLDYNTRSKVVDQNLIRGRDISPELHDELLDCFKYLKEVLEGKIKIEELIKNKPQFGTALGLEYAGQKLKSDSHSTLLLTMAY